MSSLWTPGGEHPVGRERSDAQAHSSSRPRASPTPSPPGTGDRSEPIDEGQVAAHLEELRDQLLSTPAQIVVANHAYGLFELAAIHLSQKPPRLDDARLAIDAMAAVVEGLAGRLGEPEPSLLDALAQIRLAFVQIGGAANTSDGEKSAD